jgi:integrase
MAAARRSAGESTIYQDPAGRWHAYVSMGLKDNGRRDRRHVSGKSRPAVAGRMRELELRRDAQTLGAPEKLTVGAWLEYWLENVAARKVRPSTLGRYEQLVEHQLIPKLGHHRLVRLLPEHIEKAYGELLESGRADGNGGLSPRSVVQAHAVLRRALRVATQRGKVARNVATLVEPPAVPHHEVEPFDLAAARAILKVADAEPNGLRWYVALALGPRQGECLGLTVPCVETWDEQQADGGSVPRGSIRIRHALQRQKWRHGCKSPEICGAAAGLTEMPAAKRIRKSAASCPQRRDGGLVLVPPKSRAGNRVISLPPQFVEAFRRHLEQREQMRLAAGPLWEEHDLVFCQPNGRPIDPRGDHRRWRRLLEQAGVDPKRLHDARHTAATIMLAMGVPPRVVMEILGHSQISITQNTYTHVLSSVALDAALRIGTAFDVDGNQAGTIRAAIEASA